MRPLVPGYLSAVSGASVSELDRTDWRRILVPSLIFIASFSAIFVLLGLAATGVGSALRENQDTLTNRPHNGREQERDPTWRSGRAGILPFG